MIGSSAKEYERTRRVAVQPNRTVGDSVIRSEVVRSVARRAGVTQTETRKVLQAFFEVVTFALSIGEVVSIHKFGTFDTFVRKATTHMLQGRAVTTPETKVVTFRSAKVLKQNVNDVE